MEDIATASLVKLTCCFVWLRLLRVVYVWPLTVQTSGRRTEPCALLGLREYILTVTRLPAVTTITTTLPQPWSTTRYHNHNLLETPATTTVYHNHRLPQPLSATATSTIIVSTTYHNHHIPQIRSSFITTTVHSIR